MEKQSRLGLLFVYSSEENKAAPDIEFIRVMQKAMPESTMPMIENDRLLLVSPSIPVIIPATVIGNPMIGISHARHEQHPRMRDAVERFSFPLAP